MRRLLSLTLAGLWLFSPVALAQLPGLISQPLPGSGQNWILPMQTLVFVTSLTSLPAILLMMISFTHIIIVFGLLRNVPGAPSAPPNQMLLSLALFLTFFIISPVIDKIYVDTYQPFSEEKISMQEAMEKGAQPLREFMLRQTREADLALSTRLTNNGSLQEPEAMPTRTLLPTYVTSELETAFQIGFTIFIPFLTIDLVIASVLMTLGMIIIPPATIASPLKLMLFVLIDGWRLLVGSLAQSSYSQRHEMTPESVMMMGTEAVKAVPALAAPLPLAALVTGLIVNILQAMTQIDEVTLSLIPKIVVVLIAIIVAGLWMLSLLLDYVRTLFSNIPYIIGQTTLCYRYPALSGSTS